MHPLFRFSLHQ